MPTSVTMPALGESVTEGTVTRWLKQEGERVETDEPLLEVSTDKVDTEIPSPAAGVLSSIKVGEDETVEVGVELAVIDEPGAGGGETEQAGTPDEQEPADQQDDAQQDDAQQADAHQAEQAAEPQQAEQESAQQPAAEQAPAATWQEPAPAQQAPAPQEAQQASEQPSPQVQQQPQQPTTSQPPAAQPANQQPSAAPPADEAGAYVTPLVRKLASEHGVDLSSLSGSGVGGRIRKQDVLDAAESAKSTATEAPSAPSPAQAPAEAARLRGTTEKMSRPRKVIAQRMYESLQSTAQLTTVVEADVTAIARLRQRAKADFQRREGVKLSFLPFFALAAVEALKAHPKVNAFIDVDAGEITYHDTENLGIAVDSERGLMVPVIHRAGDLNLGGLARKIADLAERTRANKVGPDELSGGTFTLTNTGSRGALFDTPILNAPQVGILGTGTVVKRPVVVDDPDLGEVISVRSMVYLALTYDHRLVDGADAARFLVTIKERLEAGAFESELGLS